MITFIHGTIRDIQDNLLMVDVNGVGYGVYVAQSPAFVLKQLVELHVHMHWNQETGPQLFGFSTALEKTLFILITNCSGIGPKLGLSLLGEFSPSSFISAITTGDVKALSSVSGVGTKKAESLILQLRDKIDKLIKSGIVIDEPASFSHLKNVSDVLTSLNYSRPEVQAALEHVKKTSALEQATFDELMRKALSFLSKQL